MKNMFDAKDAQEMVDRINQLTPDTTALWGKMAVGQMLAHCNVTYEMIYTDKHPKPNAFMRLMLKAFVKNAVVGPKPYKRNGQTAPQFLIKEDKDFAAEQERLIAYIQKTQQLGANGSPVRRPGKRT